MERRNFIKIVCGAVPAAAMTGKNGVWPKDELDREVSEPEVVFMDAEGFLTTRGEWASMSPTREEFYDYAISDLDEDEMLAWFLEERRCKDWAEYWDAFGDDGIDKNQDERSRRLEAMHYWLNGDVEVFVDVSDEMWHLYTESHNPYADAVGFCEHLGPVRCKEFGFEVVESTLAINYGEPVAKLSEDYDRREVNKKLAGAGFNFWIKE
jgi:hypothetical protein